MSDFPTDWPKLGVPGAKSPIDLAIHDLPHASSSTEWWYLNTHLSTTDGRNLSLFASFFRIVTGRDEQTRELAHAHSLTWALVDADANKYYAESLVDKSAPRLGLEKLDAGEGSRDPRLRRAIREVLERGSVPYPDRMFVEDPFVGKRRLELDFDGNRLTKLDDGSYRLELHHDYFHVGADLVFRPTKPPVRHGKDGVVHGVNAEHMFYYFIPRCEVTGTVTLNATPHEVSSGQGWYDHEFGGHRGHASGDEAGEPPRRDVAWNWLAVQLDDGRDLSAYRMIDLADGETVGQRAILVDTDGTRRAFDDLVLEPTNSWRSTRTFNDYPTKWRLTVPGAEVAVTLNGAFDDQEFITLLSKPAFWEGRCDVSGTIGGSEVSGLGFVERSGFSTVESLDDFFSAVGKEVRKSVRNLIPEDPTFEQARDMVASKAREHYMDGVEIDQLKRTMLRPVRAIADRGGKGWRSYAALACCDVVGGDSRDFIQWLAMPELMHVGSLIVDDVQDGSEIRRGGPAAHLVYGVPQCINAGTACYFMGQKLLKGSAVSDVEKLRLYDLYFETLRAGHAGQALDIDGMGWLLPEVVETGDGERLESHVLAVHRLKTAAPAASLSRMGGIAGGGTEEQIEGLGRFFESVGLAFQIVDDVLNLRGFKGDLKSKGEDIAHGKVTMPVAKAMSRLDAPGRKWLAEQLESHPSDPEVVGAVIARLESCGAIEECVTQANDLVETAWARLDPLIEDSIVKVMLRAFGWYVLDRHY